MTKQECLDFVSKNFPRDKASSKLKRIIFSTYTVKYIYFRHMPFEVSERSLKILYSVLKEVL